MIFGQRKWDDYQRWNQGSELNQWYWVSSCEFLRVAVGDRWEEIPYWKSLMLTGWQSSKRICGKMLVRKIQSLEILSVNKEAKLSASEVTEVEEGKGNADLWCSNLFTVCQRRRGFLYEEETKAAYWGSTAAKLGMLTQHNTIHKSIYTARLYKTVQGRWHNMELRHGKNKRILQSRVDQN